MGKKGSWFSAIKRVFTHNNSKDKPFDGPDKKSSKDKKKGKGILRHHGEAKSFIPLFREPSSIEDILGEADQLLIRPPTASEQLRTPPAFLGRPAFPEASSSYRVTSPKAASPRRSSVRITSPKAPISPKPAFARTITPAPAAGSSSSPKVIAQSRKEISYVQRPEPTLRYQHLSATKIQAAFRGYLARRSFRALRGLVRLQGVVRGQNVKRQTMNAMKQMQLLVRVQTQIQSRRIQVLENQALQHQPYGNDKELEGILSKWTLNQHFGNNEDWDDSVLTKVEVQARFHQKVEAVVKRERAMAYAYSHQLWKANPKAAQSPVDIRSNGYPWWWNWLDRQLPTASTSHTAPKNFTLTPPSSVSEFKPSPQLSANTYKHRSSTFNNLQEAVTTRSARSTIPVRAQQFQTPTRTPPPVIKYSKPYDVPLKDDDSLTSCPPFSVPNYMSPTVSAKAKVRANSNPKERLQGTPGNDSKRRFSFPLTPNIGSFKWGKGSKKESAPQKVLEKHNSPRSIGDLSIHSAFSMPATVGRKPFNRFV